MSETPIVIDVKYTEVATYNARVEIAAYDLLAWLHDQTGAADFAYEVEEFAQSRGHHGATELSASDLPSTPTDVLRGFLTTNSIPYFRGLEVDLEEVRHRHVDHCEIPAPSEDTGL